MDKNARVKVEEEELGRESIPEEEYQEDVKKIYKSASLIPSQKNKEESKKEIDFFTSLEEKN